MEYRFPSPLGIISLGGDGDHLTALRFLPDAADISENCSCELFETAREQLMEYFIGERREFDLPISLSGTDFQMRVWKELLNIPCGVTLSYSDIAKLIGSPKACRAVGNAVGHNPIPIIVPCHRVVAAGGIGGYSSGLTIKKKLLRLEGIQY